MMHNRLIFALSAAAAFLLANAAVATPLVIVNQGQANSCTITPADSTVFTLSTEGNVLINGSYTSGTCQGGGSVSGDPTFTPFTPAPANLTINTASLPSAGGSVTPNFVVYYANTCTGKVTATAGCPAISGAWGTGGTVCNGTNNAAGQLFCSPGSATVSIPSNPTQTICGYTFQAINCTNGTTSINSQNAVVNVAALVVGTCTEGSTSGDLSGFGYTRQCAGAVHSTNASLHPSWDNSYASLMSGAWPGSAAQMGYAMTITVSANQYASFKFNTGSTVAGVHFEPNPSYGQTASLSVSTVPGDYYSGSTSLCTGTTLNISSKSGTAATCKLSLNTDYYLNVSMASQFGTHATNCTSTACTVAMTTYSYGN